jgi:DNA-binding GntR family transcriptional regulator
MRGPTPRDILDTLPPELRTSSKTSQAYVEIRKKILTGKYQTNQLISPGEGLIHILPIRERKGTNNAAINEYRVADLNVRQRILSTRQGGFVSDVSQHGHPAHVESLVSKIQYADDEIATLLDIKPGEQVVYSRTLQRQNPQTVIAIADTFLPFWFAEVLPELEKPDFDIYQLMRQLGKEPYWCTETVDVVKATSVERILFELSPDEPADLFKIQRRAFDPDGKPLSVDFLTDRGDTYRLHYSFPLFAKDIPEKLRNT